MRSLLFVTGVLLALFGTFFALQGAGVIMWPADSFMLASRQWVINGAIIALVGVLMIFIARRRPRA